MSRRIHDPRRSVSPELVLKRHQDLPPAAAARSTTWSTFSTYEGYVQPHARERLLPTGSMELVFCRIRRFNEVLRQIEQLTDVDWMDDFRAFCDQPVD